MPHPSLRSSHAARNQLGSLDDKFTAVEKAVDRVSRWEGEWSDSSGDDTSSSDDDEGGQCRDSDDGEEEGIRDFVDNLEFGRAVELIEEREKDGSDVAEDRRYAEER